ncbi:hypothetical protein MIND_01217800 [Mycena indigotica]|uniref:DUF6535 domain-containing protein n=1 Tax=Mycena indigotica TaxID=2126181 RepID=A0A8H6VXM4_9AGAR|nr:uncharacterized protein MIND_01217800 [Mycena indigotica]KAF7291924.1 hypothetical protein MIND_01217800 [Mycena indigotica]
MPPVYTNHHGSFDDRAEEAAAAKLWSVYVDEAERYDKSLVASWKSDMEGMLIFAGLFSASLTAFLIESYKTLVQDPGDATVQLLQQILVVSSNNSTSTPIIQEPFTPAVSSLVCNALWFTSLGLSLSCALVATLLEQWARDFLHRANIRSSPVVRARIYSYLYYGLRRYKMHAVVEIIPLLLHASLIFFFGGLIAFLLPVNKIMAGLVGAILGLVMSVYAFLTIFPLLRFNSPYRTPLSNTIWGMSQSCARLWQRHKYPNKHSDDVPSTIVDNIIENAVEPSESRQERDTSALIWTTRSMSDDTELQTFVEAIPDAIWGPKQQHRRNVTLMTTLRDSEQVNLPFRIAELWRSSNNGVLSTDAIERREHACLKALWALCSVPPSPLVTPDALPSVLVHVPLFRYLRLPRSPSILSSPFFISMKAMASWNGLEWLRMYLPRCYTRTSTVSKFQPVRRYISRFFPHAAQINQNLAKLELSVSSRQQFDMASKELCDSISQFLFFEYLQRTATCTSLPYRWQETRNIIYPSGLIPRNCLVEVEAVLDTAPLHVDHTSGVPQLLVMRELCSLWQPQERRLIPNSIVEYLKHHGSDGDTSTPLDASKNYEAWRLLDTGLHAYMWRCFPTTIVAIESPTTQTLPPPSLHDVLIVIWICAQTIVESPANEPPPASKEEIQAVVEVLTTCASPMAPAVLFVVKTILVDQRIFPPPSNTAQSVSDACSPTKLEAIVLVISEFLERYVFTDVTDTARAVAALQPMMEFYLSESSVNDDLVVDMTHQTRFARSLRQLTESPQGSTLGYPVVRKVLDGAVFEPPDGLARFHWITEPAAQTDLDIVRSRIAQAVPCL